VASSMRVWERMVKTTCFEGAMLIDVAWELSCGEAFPAWQRPQRGVRGTSNAEQSGSRVLCC
jgi:hypothetical protein